MVRSKIHSLCLLGRTDARGNSDIISLISQLFDLRLIIYAKIRSRIEYLIPSDNIIVGLLFDS